jgi:myosin heavy subunit
MADEDDLFADEHFGDFEEQPKIDSAFDEDEEKQAEPPEPSPKKKKKKKKHLSVQKDLQFVEADNYEAALDKLRNEISEAPESVLEKEDEEEPQEEPEPENEPQEEPEKEHEVNDEEAVASPSHSVTSNSTPKSFKKKKKEIVDSDTQIQQLKEQNQELKMQLLELNNALDDALTKKGVKIEKKRTNMLVTNDKEVKNLMKQIEMYKKENEELKRQIYSNTDVHRVVQLENKLQESKIIIDQLNEEKKSLQVVQRKQGKALEEFSSGNDKTVDTLKSDISYLKAKIDKMNEAKLAEKEVLTQKEKMLAIMEGKVREYEAFLKDKNLSKDGLARMQKLEKENEEKTKALEERTRERDIETKAKQSVEKKLKVFQQTSKLEMKKLQDELSLLTVKLDEKDREVRATTLQLKNNSSVATITNSPTMAPPREPSPVKSPDVEKKPLGGNSTNSKIPKPSSGPKSADSDKRPPKPAPVQQKREVKVPTRTNAKSKIPSGPKKDSSPTTGTKEPSPRMQKTEEEKSAIIVKSPDSDQEVMEDMEDDFIGDEDEPVNSSVQEDIPEKTAAPQTSVFKPMF